MNVRPTYYVQHGSAAKPPMLTERVTSRVDKYDRLCLHCLGHWRIVHTDKYGIRYIMAGKDRLNVVGA